MRRFHAIPTGRCHGEENPRSGEFGAAGGRDEGGMIA